MELEEKFEELLDEFDFLLVEKVMSLMDWKWAIDGVLVQPRIYQMKAHCRRLFNDAYETLDNFKRDVDYTCASGGFQVTVDKFQNIILEFVITHREYIAESKMVI